MRQKNGKTKKHFSRNSVAFFCDVSCNNEVGLVWREVDENDAEKRISLGDHDRKDAILMASFLESKNLVSTFIWHYVLQGGGTGLSGGRDWFWELHREQFIAFEKSYEADDNSFLPELFESPVQLECHSLGLIFENVSNTEKLVSAMKTKKFSAFAAALTAKFCSSKWHATRYHENFSVLLCSFDTLHPEMGFDDRDPRMYEFHMPFAFRERFGWFAKQCQNQLRFYQSAMRIKPRVKTKVLYFGPDRGGVLTENEICLDISTLRLGSAKRTFVSNLKKSGWTEAKHGFFRKQSMIVLISSGGDLHKYLENTLKRLLEVNFQIKDDPNILNLKGVFDESIMVEEIKKNKTSKVFDLSGNRLHWSVNREIFELLDRTVRNGILKRIDLQDNNLYGEEFVNWMEQLLSQNVVIVLRDNPQTKGFHYTDSYLRLIETHKDHILL